MVDNLARANFDANRHSRDSRGELPKDLELDIDCSDPYGRLDVDADGHGGNTIVTDDEPNNNDADENTKNNNNSTKTVSKVKVPTKRVTIYVATSPPVHHQQTVVLSAAVSSTKRIHKDCHVAVMIAKRLDIARAIPSELRCQTVLKKLFPTLPTVLLSDLKDYKEEDESENNEERKQLVEDALDVTIAYLRRVHLFTFYNGCTFADHVGAVVSGNHASSTIHLRLKGADEILKKTREENADIYDDLPMAEENDSNETNNNAGAPNTTSTTTSVHSSAEMKDMLVMRLDDSIEKVLQSITNAMETPSPFIVNETVDAIAREIESSEEKAKKEWINNHAVIDNDGRARCSFHFCNKLFKDETFLQKHLLKKHPEFLQAEMAKTHDSYMMDWWEKEENRGLFLPHVCIDCGSKFGLQLASVQGATVPIVHDPEPDLWKEEQEHIRRMEEEEERFREKRAAAESMDRRRTGSMENIVSTAGSDGMQGMPTGNVTNNNSSNFVDVDDMKDEKVELSFDNVNIVTVMTNKSNKKKKRKKLL